MEQRLYATLAALPDGRFLSYRVSPLGALTLVPTRFRRYGLRLRLHSD
jgi:hypothetical protein